VNPTTRFTDLVGCTAPIQLAAMSGIVTPELAVAVSEAGGLGMLAVGRRSYDQMTPQIDAVLARTDRPVGAGFIVEFLDRDTVAAIAERLPVLEFFWGAPDPTLVAGECAGRIVGWQVGSVDEAKAAVDAGCRYVVAQGVEAGGHVRGTIEMARLLPAVRAAVGDETAVLAAGGIATAADVRNAFDAGADAVRVGTRFVAATESAAHDRYVDRLIDAGDDATELTTAFGVGWSDAPHRVLRSALESAADAADVVGSMPGPDGAPRDVVRWFVSPPTIEYTGEIDAMALYAGAHLSPITRRLPAVDIIAELLDTSGRARRSLSPDGR
jgi:nitronate monooxygenase